MRHTQADRRGRWVREVGNLLRHCRAARIVADAGVFEFLRARAASESSRCLCAGGAELAQVGRRSDGGAGFCHVYVSAASGLQNFAVELELFWYIFTQSSPTSSPYITDIESDAVVVGRTAPLATRQKLDTHTEHTET